MATGQDDVNERPWEVFHRHFPTLKPPLAVAPDVVRAIASAIEGRTQRALLLGVTPALVPIADDTTALDWSEPMVARVWPGDTATRRAQRADWRAMPFTGQVFTAVIGDGSFNCLDYPNDYLRVFSELERVAHPGAAFAVRFFVTPSPGEALGDVRAAAMAGQVGAIDALKWRLGMAVAARSGPNVARNAIHAAFEEAFPGREALLAATNWDAADLEAIDWYRGAPDIISFPTESEILAVVPPSMRNPRFLPSGKYELAGRCPILAGEFRP